MCVFQRLLSDPVVTWRPTGVVLSKSVSTWRIMQQDLKTGKFIPPILHTTARLYRANSMSKRDKNRWNEMFGHQDVLTVCHYNSHYHLFFGSSTSLSLTLLLHQLPFVTMETLSSHPFSPSSNPSIKRQSSIPRLHPLSLSLPLNNGPYQDCSVYFNVS